MSRSAQFAADVEAYLIETGMAPAAFGKAAVNDPNFVGDIRNGRQPGLGLVDRVYQFMRAGDEPSDGSSTSEQRIPSGDNKADHTPGSSPDPKPASGVAHPQDHADADLSATDHRSGRAA